ncbi:hypothetical protein ABZX63_23880, partial [Streptomyces tendae]|uniref:hypothetical protein n=1 Tax=Streptomyces tendae TaxID=1932 RepID=UPI0033BF16B1
MRYIRLVPIPHGSDADADADPHDADWSTRHSVLSTARRTAALVNVLAAGPADAVGGPAPEAVAEVLRAYGEKEPFDLTARDVEGMREAAALLRDVFAAESADAAAHVLNRLLGAHTGRLRLSSHRGGSPWHPHVDRADDAPWPEWFLASSCLAVGGGGGGPAPPPPRPRGG